MGILNRYIIFHAKCLVWIGIILFIIIIYCVFEYISVRKNYHVLWGKVIMLERHLIDNIIKISEKQNSSYKEEFLNHTHQYYNGKIK